MVDGVEEMYGRSQGNPQILIIDDDTAICEAMCEYIEMHEFKAKAVYSAEEAIEVLEKDDGQIQVVITDIMLPGMDGLELTELIKKRFDADVIVITGFIGDFSYEEVINKGASDFVCKPVQFKELMMRLKRVLRERELKQELQFLAITDELTQLYNKRHFDRQLELEVNRSIRYKRPLSLLIMDIDHFKTYNDTHGHPEGNKVLAQIGKIIRPILRKSDSAYRYGGEEFTIILPETNRYDAEIVADRIRSKIESERFFLPEHNMMTRITISIGVTEYSYNEDINTFIQRTDHALLTSKKNGRNRVTCLHAGESVS